MKLSTLFAVSTCLVLFCGMMSCAHAFGLFGFDGLSDPFGSAFHPHRRHHPRAELPLFSDLFDPHHHPSHSHPHHHHHHHHHRFPSHCDRYAEPLDQTEFFSVDTADGRREIVAALPGLSLRDVQVNRERNGHLRVRAVRPVEYSCRAFVSLSPSYHLLSRTLELPASVETSAIRADFKQGRLVISFPLPLKQESEARTAPFDEAAMSRQTHSATPSSSSSSSSSRHSSSSSSSSGSRASSTPSSTSAPPSTATNDAKPRWKFTPEELEALTATAQRIAQAPIGIGTGSSDADIAADLTNSSAEDSQADAQSDCFDCLDEEGLPRYYHIALARDS